MEKIFLIFGGISFLIGIIILYLTEIFTFYVEFVHGIGILDIERYNFSYYAIACFCLGVISILVGLFGKKYNKI